MADSLRGRLSFTKGLSRTDGESSTSLQAEEEAERARARAELARDISSRSMQADPGPATAPRGRNSALWSGGSSEGNPEEDARREARREKTRETEGKKGAEAMKARKKRAKARERRAKQEEEDARWDRCEKCQEVVAKLAHVLDGLIGLTCVVYGSLIATQFEEPATAAVATCLSYGSVLLLTALAGVLSFYSNKCGRRGLNVSAWTAPVITFFYVLVLILLCSKSLDDNFFNYLTEHADVLYLGDAAIDAVRKCLPFLYIVMLSLAGFEVCRFLLLRHLRVKLLAFDAANAHLAKSHAKNAKGKSSRSKRSKTSSRGRSSRGRSSGGGGSTIGRKGSGRSDLTERLLDEEEGTGSREDY